MAYSTSTPTTRTTRRDAYEAALAEREADYYRQSWRDAPDPYIAADLRRALSAIGAV